MDDAQLDAQPREAQHAAELADKQAKEYGQTYAREEAHGVHAGKVDSGVGKGEERDNLIVDGHLQLVLQVLQGADEVVAGRLHALEQGYVLVAQHDGLVAVGACHGGVGEVLQATADAFDVELRAARQVGRHAEGQHYARYGGVDAAVKHTVPEQQARVEIEGLGADAELVACGEHRHDDGRGQEEPVVQVLGVAYGYYDDAAQVVGYGQGCKEDFQADGAALAEDAQAAQREGDVGSHRDGHAALHDGVLRAHQEEEYHGDYHAAARSDDGRQGFLHARQLAAKQLTLYLESDAQEEDGHEVVVDEVAQRHGVSAVAEHIEVAQAQRDGQAPQLAVEVAPGTVGNNQGQNGGNGKQHTTAHVLA